MKLSSEEAESEKLGIGIVLEAGLWEHFNSMCLEVSGHAACKGGDGRHAGGDKMDACAGGHDDRCDEGHNAPGGVGVVHLH